jgi:hypothetical protein
MTKTKKHNSAESTKSAGIKSDTKNTDRKKQGNPQANKVSPDLVGVYCFDSDSGAGSFNWSGDVAGLIEYELLPFLEYWFEDDELKEAVSRCEELAKRCKEDKLSFAEAVGQLEVILEPRILFSWHGTYAQLCAGKDKFARDVIESFVESTRGEDDDTIVSEELRITPDLQDAFDDFLLAYGH